MTVKMYDEDSYIKSFKAVVLGCEEKETGFEIILDRTAFFPEGGGQLADTGLIAGAFVKDVLIVGDKIIHYTDEKVEFGKTVNCEIDWGRRFVFMQQHTGEHIVSGVINRFYGYDNVGFHLGTEMTTMDYSGSLTDDDLRNIEVMVNQAIYDNIEVSSRYYTNEELESIEYRSKEFDSDNIRLVDIPDVDVCACCAPQVKRTGEIGIIKLIRAEKYKGGSRVYMLCGFRALNDYNMKEEQIRELAKKFSVKENFVFEAVEKLREELLEKKILMSSLKKELIEYKVDKISEYNDKVLVIEENMENNVLREYAEEIYNKTRATVVALAKVGDNSFNYVIFSSDVDEILKEMNDKFSSKGGGRGNTAQGKLEGDKEKIMEFFNDYTVV